MPPTFSRKKKTKAKFARKFGEPPLFRVRYPGFLPPLLPFLLVVGVLFLLGGGLYMAVQTPPLLTSLREGPSFIVPGQVGEQTLTEGILFMLFLFLGVASGYLAHKSLRERYGLGRSSIPLAVAMVLFALGLFGVQMLLQLKLSPP